MITASLIFLHFFTRITIISIASSSKSPNPTSIRPLKKIPGEGISWDIQRKWNFLYADKSVYLERLLEDQQSNVFFYITRPQRFGKSSFLIMSNFFSTVRNLFKEQRIYNRGNADFFKEPFGGVPEELKDQKWIRCPVIYLDFRQIEHFDTMTVFKGSYARKLRIIAWSYGLDSLEREPIFDISDLIFELEFKFKLKVVVLVDEFDSPFYNALEKKKNPALADEIRCFLDDLFGSKY